MRICLLFVDRMETIALQSFSLDADEFVNALSEQAGDHSVQTLLDDALLTLTQYCCDQQSLTWCRCHLHTKCGTNVSAPAQKLTGHVTK